MAEYEMKRESEIKQHGIVIGVAVPKTIPLKTAIIKSSLALEKGELQFASKTHSKKIYNQLFNQI